MLRLFWCKTFSEKCFPHFLVFGTTENEIQRKTFSMELVHFGGKCFTDFKPVKRFSNVKRRVTNTSSLYLSTSTTIIIITKLTTTSTTTPITIVATTTTATTIIVTFITTITTKRRKRNCFSRKYFSKKIFSTEKHFSPK